MKSALPLMRLTGTGPIIAVRHAEREFAQRFEHQRNLRPAYFMENNFQHLGSIAQSGVIYSAMSPDHPFATVATADIADVAARVVLSDFEGHANVGIHGPRDLSQRQQVEEIAKGLGRPVQLVSVL